MLGAWGPHKRPECGFSELLPSRRHAWWAGKAESTMDSVLLNSSTLCSYFWIARCTCRLEIRSWDQQDGLSLAKVDKPEDPSSIPRTYIGGKRELIPQSCPLIFFSPRLKKINT